MLLLILWKSLPKCLSFSVTFPRYHYVFSPTLLHVLLSVIISSRFSSVPYTEWQCICFLKYIKSVAHVLLQCSFCKDSWHLLRAPFVRNCLVNWTYFMPFFSDLNTDSAYYIVCFSFFLEPWLLQNKQYIGNIKVKAWV